MQKFAVIDIGSNSVRLMFVADGNVLYKRLQTTRLGEGLARANRLTEPAIARSAQAVSDFYAQAIKDGAQSVYAFATAAVRSAQNGSAFTLRVHALCGLRVEVIDGETEALLGVLGALGESDGAVVDVGGASTELVIKSGGTLTYKKSVDIGVVRLKDSCGTEREKLFTAASLGVARFGQPPKISACYAIGGTATTLGALAAGLKEYDANAVTGTEITCEEMCAWAEKLLGLKIEEIAALPCVAAGRADVLTGGAVWLSTLMQRLGIKKLIVSDKDNLEGYAVWKGLL